MQIQEATLVLIRHGESEWNKENLFTGWKNPGLSQKGEKEALAAGKSLKQEGHKFTTLFTSALIRAQRTGEIILEEINQANIEIKKDKALNERNYGSLAGLNKDEARKKWGEKQVHIWRRSYDINPPEGESLKDTAERVLPYFHKNIFPLLEKGENILVAAHRNSLRALVMYLDELSPEEVVGIELKTGMPIVYSFKENGTVRDKRFIET